MCAVVVMVESGVVLLRSVMVLCCCLCLRVWSLWRGWQDGTKYLNVLLLLGSSVAIAVSKRHQYVVDKLSAIDLVGMLFKS